LVPSSKAYSALIDRVNDINKNAKSGKDIFFIGAIDLRYFIMKKSNKLYKATNIFSYLNF